MVKWYWKCNGCGFISIHFDNGTIKAVTEKYIKDNGIALTKAVRFYDILVIVKIVIL